MTIGHQGKPNVYSGNKTSALADIADKTDVLRDYSITPQTVIMPYWAKLAP